MTVSTQLLLMDKINFHPTILGPSITSTFKGLTRIDRSHVALIAQLGEHCTGIAEVVGSNPAQSLNFFSGLCSSSVTATLALMTVSTL